MYTWSRSTKRALGVPGWQALPKIHTVKCQMTTTVPTEAHKEAQTLRCSKIWTALRPQMASSQRVPFVGEQRL